MIKKTTLQIIKDSEVLADGKTPVNIIRLCQKITSTVVIQSFFGEDIMDKKIDGKNLFECIEEFLG